MSDTWFFEITPTRLGWTGLARTVDGRLAGRRTHARNGMVVTVPLWRLTEAGAHRALLREIRRLRREIARDARARVYPVRL